MTQYDSLLTCTTKSHKKQKNRIHPIMVILQNDQESQRIKGSPNSLVRESILHTSELSSQDGSSLSCLSGISVHPGSSITGTSFLGLTSVCPACALAPLAENRDNSPGRLLVFVPFFYIKIEKQNVVNSGDFCLNFLLQFCLKKD